MSSSASPPTGMATPARTTPTAIARRSSISVKPGAKTGLLLRACTVSLISSNGDERLQLEKALFTDPFHVHQLFDLLERAVFLSVVDDPLGGAGADAGQGLQLCDGCGVEVDGTRGSCLGLCRPGSLCGLWRCDRRLRDDGRDEDYERKQNSTHGCPPERVKGAAL